MSYINKISIEQAQKNAAKKKITMDTTSSIQGKKFYSYRDVIDNFMKYGEMPPQNVQETFILSYDFQHNMDLDWQQKFVNSMTLNQRKGFYE